MMKLLVLTFAIASSVMPLDLAFAQRPRAARSAPKNANVVAEIKRLENELARAVIARDYAALQRIESDTYVYTDSDAVVTTRDDFIREYKAGTSKVSVLRFDDMTVDVYGDAAVVRGLLTVERETNGVRIARTSRYTRVYIRFHNGWQAVVGHSSTLKTQP